MPDGWSVYEWKAAGSYASQRKNGTNGNGSRERIWFSQACLPVESEAPLLVAG